MAMCDRCDIEIERKDGYLFYSSGMAVTYFPVALSGVNSELGLLFLCKECTDFLITDERFQNPGKACIDISDMKSSAEALPAIFEARDHGIIERCLSLGFTAEEAKKNAKNCNLRYMKEGGEQTAQQQAIQFWNVDRDEKSKEK